MLVRLLIVDDEELMVKTLTMFMQDMCSLIDSTDNLADAITMASKNHYNLIILDLRLKVTGKEEALMSIRKLKSFGTSVIVVSGLLEPSLKEQIMAAGADAYVPKDGNSMSRSLLLAANVAVLHLPHDSFKSDSFSEHVTLLEKMAHA